MYYHIWGAGGEAKQHILGFIHLCMYSFVLREQAAITIYDNLVEAGVLDVDHTKS